jgi:threonine dehydratase
MEIARERGLKYINGFDHPDIIAGQGTIGLEILEQVSNLTALLTIFCF